LSHLWPTGSSSGQPPSITARYFSAYPSDSISRWTPCPPECCYRERLQVHLGCIKLSPSCPFRLLHTFSLLRPARHYSRFWIQRPHPGAGGTSTLLNNALLSAHYGTVRLLQHVHVRRSVYGLRGPALIVRPRHAGRCPGSRACYLRHINLKTTALVVTVYTSRENTNIRTPETESRASPQASWKKRGSGPSAISPRP
jgi:hypothetical protein